LVFAALAVFVIVFVAMAPSPLPIVMKPTTAPPFPESAFDNSLRLRLAEQPLVPVELERFRLVRLDLTP